MMNKKAIAIVGAVIARRDEVAIQEGIDIVVSALDEMQEYIDVNDIFAAEDIWMNETGLEIDYWMDVALF